METCKKKIITLIDAKKIKIYPLETSQKSNKNK